MRFEIKHDQEARATIVTFHDVEPGIFEGGDSDLMPELLELFTSVAAGFGAFSREVLNSGRIDAGVLAVFMVAQARVSLAARALAALADVASGLRTASELGFPEFGDPGLMID